MRRLPLIPTLIVLAAVAVMLRLGFWQLDRLHQKEAMLAQYRAALADPALHPLDGSGRPPPYSRVTLTCHEVLEQTAKSGRNARGEAGWAQVARCTVAGNVWEYVVLGWSATPATPKWSGGPVTGIALVRGDHYEVVADPPLAGLAANAWPDPADLPNNHLSYAVQWFLFAATALAIYGLALRKRLAAAGEGG